MIGSMDQHELVGIFGAEQRPYFQIVLFAILNMLSTVM
jgi:hypothetical protein